MTQCARKRSFPPKTAQNKGYEKLTVSILGAGHRGADVYGQAMARFPKRFEVVSLCDLHQSKLDKYGAILNVPEERRFLNENEFFKERRSDVIVIAAQDQDHVRHALKAIELGYDILLEKPISGKSEELYRLMDAANAKKTVILVCHVLRYALAVLKLKELLDAKKIGRIISIESIEKVGYWHYCHSFDRGNWRNSNETSPMILQKCCHDFDLLQWFAASKCETLSSVGDLTFFKPENKPADATERCLDCPHKETCPFSTINLYIKRWHMEGDKQKWPYNVITDKTISEESLKEAMRNTRYGECVFNGHNNVVDHQEVLLQFENGITVTHSMMAFTADGGRLYSFYGTEGELIWDEQKEEIRLMRFGEREIVIDTKALGSQTSGHGGGDDMIVKSFYDAVVSKGKDASALINKSIESHLIAIKAEESRLEGGVRLKVHRD